MKCECKLEVIGESDVINWVRLAGVFTVLLAVGFGCGGDSGGDENNNNNGQNNNNVAGTCGDGTVQGAEECDNGAANSDDTPDACRTNCLLPACGDAVTDSGEGCDDGIDNDDTQPNACRLACVLPVCGDDVIDDGAQFGEECDDGNTDPGDGCAANCLIEGVCGNSIVEGNEQCDDGNTTGGDGCSADCLSDETCRNGVHDSALGEGCDDGNAVSHDGCSSGCLTETATWNPESPPSAPPARTRHAMAYDRSRGVSVVFGGILEVGFPPTIYGDTWEYDGANWSQVGAAGPTARESHAMAYDESRGVIVLFGGNDAAIGQNIVSDTWEYNGIGWTNANPASAPPARIGHAMAYDSTAQRILVFGGGNGGFTDLNDLWSFDGLTWTQITTAVAPGPRAGHTIAFDPTLGLLLHGGAEGLATLLADTWVFDGVSWVDASPLTTPPGRIGASMVFDYARGRVVLFSGGRGSRVLPEPSPTTWEFDGVDWAGTTNVTPPERGGAAAYHGARRGVILFGGEDVSTPGSQPEVDATVFYRFDSAETDEACTGGGDEDGDGLADCADPDCGTHPSC